MAQTKDFEPDPPAQPATGQPCITYYHDGSSDRSLMPGIHEEGRIVHVTRRYVHGTGQTSFRCEGQDEEGRFVYRELP